MQLQNFLRSHGFLEKARELTPHLPTAQFLSERHLILYSLFCLESEPIKKEFFWLLFDMYGPSWIPLPKDYHFSYWEGFSKFHNAIEKALHSDPAVTRLFVEARNGIVHQAATAMLGRYRLWQDQVAKHIRRLLCLTTESI